MTVAKPLSALDLYSIGIGPSSSHTVGPMRAARRFAQGLAAADRLFDVRRVRCELFGSLGATGRGHGSDSAVLLGLEGEDPETVDTDAIGQRVERIRGSRSVALLGKAPVDFVYERDLVLHGRRTLPGHSNGMRFSAWDARGALVDERVSYSIGGGFVVDEGEEPEGADHDLSHRFCSAAELLAVCRHEGLAISDVMLANEAAWRPEQETRDGLLHVWEVMKLCVGRGYRQEGTLPGGLRVRRRAPELYRSLTGDQAGTADPLHVMDWVNLYALAVNEENAAGGRVVTAPTNGAAGIVPAVLHYYERFVPGATTDGVVRFLLTAAAIGMLIKSAASISGAEVGCQGEIGSACAMAAAGLCELLGGTPEQVENAAEIGLEHNLGLTCDPVAGLVQVPCIERNAIGAVKAINAARLAMGGDGVHRVTLDEVIRTMRDTGRDMSVKYKETSRGGLAVNVTAC